MKKITIMFAFMFASFSVFLSGCDKGNSETNDNIIRLNEVTHSVFYAPLYIAINNGYFEDEGLEIELTNGGGSNNSMTALLTDAADIALMGPETSVFVATEGASDLPKIFGQLTKKDGSFLIGRTPEPNFDWEDLENKEIIGGRAGGSPAMSLEYALNQNGLVDGSNVTLNLDVAFTAMVSTFDSGVGDYVTMFEPTASNYVAAGNGYYIASVGQESGDIPFTAFMANESYLENHADKAESFLRAIVRGYNYLMNESTDNIVESLKPSFSTTSDETLAAAIESYISIDVWSSSPVTSASSFDKLQDVMINAGQITEKIDFSLAIDNTIAYKVIA